MSDDIRVEKDDVTVEEIADECDECTVGPTTHVVAIDFRSAGMQHAIGRYCHECAEMVAARIRDGFPAAEPAAGESSVVTDGAAALAASPPRGAGA